MEIHEKDMIEFLSLCESYGGYCDCEILFNVEGRVKEVKEVMEIINSEKSIKKGD